MSKSLAEANSLGRYHCQLNAQLLRIDLKGKITQQKPHTKQVHVALPFHMREKHRTASHYRASTQHSCERNQLKGMSTVSQHI